MKIITLWQPWASLIALGCKQYETRSWYTNYRGRILIHAAIRSMNCNGHFLLDILEREGFWKPFMQDLDGDTTDYRRAVFPTGVIVAIADLTNCFYMIDNESDRKVKHRDTIVISSVSEQESLCGDWQFGRYAWKLENIKALQHPISFKGSQGLKPASDEIAKELSDNQIFG